MMKQPTTVRNGLRAMALTERGKDPHKKGKASCCKSSKATLAKQVFSLRIYVDVAMKGQQCPGKPEKKVGRFC